MKVSILLSASLGILSFTGQAQAVMPDASASLDTCLSWANSLEGKGAVKAGTTRCYALDDCNKNESEDVESLRECLMAADDAFEKSEGVSAVAGRELEEDEAPLSSGVSTRAADSYYEMKGGDEKGWRNSDVGD